MALMLIPIDEALLLDSPDALQQQIDIRRADLANHKAFGSFPAIQVGEVVKLTLALKRLTAAPAAHVVTLDPEPPPAPRGTPPEGPWSYRLWAHRDRWQEASIRVGDAVNAGNVIATVFLGGPGGTSRTDPDIEATARLIAAAPVMLEVLRWLRSCEEEINEYGLREIDKAIEAATGEKP